MTFARTIAATRTPVGGPPAPVLSVRWNFRETQAFGGAEEVENEIWANSTFGYPHPFVTPDGDNVTAGWTNTLTLDNRDRDAAQPRHLRGITFISNSASRRAWQVDVTGEVTVHACFGDASAGQRMRCEFFDGPMTLPGEGFGIWEFIVNEAEWAVMDYTSNPVTAAQYFPSSAAFEYATQLTISQYLTVAVGVHSSGVAATTLASLEVNKLS